MRSTRSQAKHALAAASIPTDRLQTSSPKRGRGHKNSHPSSVSSLFTPSPPLSTGNTANKHKHIERGTSATATLLHFNPSPHQASLKRKFNDQVTTTSPVPTKKSKNELKPVRRSTRARKQTAKAAAADASSSSLPSSSLPSSSLPSSSLPSTASASTSSPITRPSSSSSSTSSSSLSSLSSSIFDSPPAHPTTLQQTTKTTKTTAPTTKTTWKEPPTTPFTPSIGNMPSASQTARRWRKDKLDFDLPGEWASFGPSRPRRAALRFWEARGRRWLS